MKLSLIMNLYNACEKELEASLSKVRDSYLKNDEYELIVIDDGSTKNYSEIIKKYNPVYVKTNHRGNLSAILYGIMIAKGEYVAFLNTGIFPTFNYYRGMLDMAKGEDADIVVGELAYSEKGTIYKNKLDAITRNEISVENEHILRFFMRDLIEAESIPSLCNKIFSKKLLLLAKKELEKTNAVSEKSYDEYGDMLLCFFASKYAKKMVKSNTGCAVFALDGEKNEENIKEKTLSFDIIDSALPENEYTEEMKKNAAFDRSVYEKNSVGLCKKIYLGDNFLEIDRELSKFYKSNGPVNLIYDKKDAYVSDIIDEIVKNEGKEISSSAQKLIVVPKRKISLIQKIAKLFA